MADTCGSDTIFSRIAIDGTSPTNVIGDFTAADPAFQLDGDSDLSFHEEQINPETLNGRIVADSELSVPGNVNWDGGFGVLLSPDVIFHFMPYILGGAWTSLTSSPTDAAPPDINLLLHKDAYLYPYSLGKIDEAVISGEQGKPVRLRLKFLGKTRLSLTAGSTWPASLDVNVSAPYMFENFVVTVGGTIVKCRKWQITRKNNLGYRYWGSTSPDCIKRDARTQTTITLTMPHSTAIVPLFVNHTASTNRNVVLTGTHPVGAQSCVINLPYTQFPKMDPPVSGSEILVETTGTARGLAGAREITVVNDNTP